MFLFGKKEEKKRKLCMTDNSCLTWKTAQKLSDVMWTRAVQKHKQTIKLKWRLCLSLWKYYSSDISAKNGVTNWACYTLPFLFVFPLGS